MLKRSIEVAEGRKRDGAGLGLLVFHSSYEQTVLHSTKSPKARFQSLYFGTFMFFQLVLHALIWQRTRDCIPFSLQQAYCVRRSAEIRSREDLNVRLMGPQPLSSLSLQILPLWSIMEPMGYPGLCCTWLEPAQNPSLSQKHPHGLLHPCPLSMLADIWPCWANSLTGAVSFSYKCWRNRTLYPKRTTSSKPRSGRDRLPPSGPGRHCRDPSQREVPVRAT